MFANIFNSSLSRFALKSKQLSILPKYYIASNSLKSELSRLYDKMDKSESEGRIMDIQNGVVFFKTPKDVPLGYKSLIKLKNDTPAVILSLNDQVSAALLLKEAEVEVGDQLEFSIEGSEGVYTNVDLLNFGKIVNYLGKPINDPTAEPQGAKANIFSVSGKKQQRKQINTQLFTGNIAVDFTKPLAQGNFIVFQGDSNTGKTHLAARTAINFIKNRMFDKSDNAKKVIYVNVNINETNTIFKDLQDADCQDDVIAFSVDSKLPSSYYFTPLAALAYANYLKNNGTDVLMIFDDMVEHYVKEMLIFNTVNQPFAPLNIVNEIYASTGVFEKGSLTTILVYDSNQAQLELQPSLRTYHTHIESLCDVKIDFDFKDPLYKTTLPKIETVASANIYYWMPRIMKIYAKGLSQLLNELKNEKDSMIKKKELQVQVDPWDCYLFLDSTYFMRLLISSRKMNAIEELILVGFTLRAIEQDTISYFKDDPKILVDELFKFIRELKEFEKTDLISYIYRLAERDIDSPETSNLIVESINRVYELFFMHCRIQNKLLPYKKDYFS